MSGFSGARRAVTVPTVDTTRDFLIPWQQIALSGLPPYDTVERARLSRKPEND